jgi:hypothetical protein
VALCPKPQITAPPAAFLPFVRTGKLHLCFWPYRQEGWEPLFGKLGEHFTTADGKEAARNIAIELLATLQPATGDLNLVKRIVKLLVNSAAAFTEQHLVVGLTHAALSEQRRSLWALAWKLS